MTDVGDRDEQILDYLARLSEFTGFPMPAIMKDLVREMIDSGDIDLRELSPGRGY